MKEQAPDSSESTRALEWTKKKERKKAGSEGTKNILPSVEGKKRELNWGTQCSTEKERICAHKKPRMSQACKIMGPISTK
jgi:hypothetical protein